MYPKATTNQLYLRLLKQCENVGISVKSKYEDTIESNGVNAGEKDSLPSLIVDAIFGFSFNARSTSQSSSSSSSSSLSSSSQVSSSNASPIRAPFASLIEWMVNVQRHVPIASVDVPSGWDVEEGDILKTGQAHNVYLFVSFIIIIITSTAYYHHLSIF